MGVLGDCDIQADFVSFFLIGISILLQYTVHWSKSKMSPEKGKGRHYCYKRELLMTIPAHELHA